MVKSALEVELPTEFDTVIGPVLAPVGTCARTCVSESRSIFAAEVPLKEISVKAEKFVPEIVTSAPTGPVLGENEVGTGVYFVRLEVGDLKLSRKITLQKKLE